MQAPVALLSSPALVSCSSAEEDQNPQWGCVVVKPFSVVLGSKRCPGRPQLRWDRAGLFNEERKQGDLW